MPCGATGRELAEHVVQPVHGRDPPGCHLLPASREHAQGDRVVRSDDPQVSAAKSSHGDRVGVRVVGLAAATATQGTDPRGQPGWHVVHRLALGDQPLRQAGTDTAGALDGLDPVAIRAGERAHRSVDRSGRDTASRSRGHGR